MRGKKSQTKTCMKLKSVIRLQKPRTANLIIFKRTHFLLELLNLGTISYIEKGIKFSLLVIKFSLILHLVTDPQITLYL